MCKFNIVEINFICESVAKNYGKHLSKSSNLKRRNYETTRRL